MQTLLRLFQLTRGQNRRLAGTIILNTLLGLFALAPPYVLKTVIDILIKSGQHPAAASMRPIELAALSLLGIYTLMGVVEFFQERFSDLLRLDTIIQLRGRLYEHVLELSIDFYETHRAGEITEKITQSIYDFGIWIQDTSRDMLYRILVIIFATVVIIILNPLAGIVIAIMAVVRIWEALRKKKLSRPYRDQSRQIQENIQGNITESIQNLTTLRSLGGEQGALQRYEALAADIRRVRLMQHRIEWRYNSVASVIEGVGIAAAVMALAYSILHGNATASDILLVMLYIQMIITSIRGMASYFDLTGELISSCDRVLELLDIRPTVVDTPDATDLSELKSIEFQDVSFSYPGHDQQVLNQVSFELKPGQIIALVGPSGTGKTTIVKLLLRLYEPTSGHILINNQPIENYTGASLRRHIGTVMQDVALFNDTFADNVLLADPKASKSDLEAAVRQAHAQEFVNKLPKGYDTLVGERGIKLSGGQKQRVAIARAILKKPELVILDEATSALDTVSEREVQKGLDGLLEGRMAVVIAHRLSTIMHADEILVIEDGVVEERGNHQQLLKNKGLYAKLFTMQSDRLLA
jgi:ABC-type multidrug transport system fused ATPase/permease subunit